MSEGEFWFQELTGIRRIGRKVVDDSGSASAIRWNDPWERLLLLLFIVSLELAVIRMNGRKGSI